MRWGPALFTCMAIHRVWGAEDPTVEAAIEAMGAVLAGSGKPFITTSGTAGLAVGRLADEDSQADRSSPMSTRLISEDLTFGLVSQGVRGMVGACRLPSTARATRDLSRRSSPPRGSGAPRPM